MCLFFLNILPPGNLLAAPLEDIQDALRDCFETPSQDPPPEETVGTFPNIDIDLISDSYRENDFTPLWVDESGPTQCAHVLLDFLEKSSLEGLNPADYFISSIGNCWGASEPSSLAHLDMILTFAFHSYVYDVREGRVDPCKNYPYLFACARDRTIRTVDLVNQLQSYENLESFLGLQPPDTQQYRDLKKALSFYRSLEKAGGWATVPEGPLLKAGGRDDRIPIIRDRLLATDDLAATDIKDTLQYDDVMVEAVKRFQKRHGLKQDGIIGNDTRNALNIPVSSKIRKILINMERLRWISRDLSERFVMVNIASFRLSVFNDSHFIFEMPVIVGTRYRETPVFSEYIRYIDFNPYWNIPPFIAIMDILPKIRENASYLSDRKIRIFDGWKTDAGELDPSTIDWSTITVSKMGEFKLRQDSGAKNPLGRIKFMFPNRFAVYLHDSPSKDLFERTERTFSSGCIRVSQPVKLAAYLLGGGSSDWDEATIQKIIDKGNRRVVSLDPPIPVHIIYLTTCVGPDGLLYFNRDVYGRDKILEEALFHEDSVI